MLYFQCYLCIMFLLLIIFLQVNQVILDDELEM